nr:D-ala D-ala ligase [uncultured bacterium]
MKVLVIGGGISDEREVSLRSANAIFEGAKSAGHEVEFYDWDGSKDWLNKNIQDFDVCLPILHGKGGEDGQIQSILEKSGSHFLGSSSDVSRVCFDKRLVLDTLKRNQIMIPEGVLVNHDQYKKHKLINRPHILKPNKGGSSLGVVFVRDPSHIDSTMVDRVFSEWREMLLEEIIEGTEITVPVLDGLQMPIIKIIPPEAGEFDYENKYNGATKEIVNPEEIDQKLKDESQKLGKKIHNLLKCRHLSRTDMILTAEGELYVLEVNTMPGMTNQSLFPKAAGIAGLSFDQLADYFIKLAAGKL